jgi:hypothetical protein
VALVLLTATPALRATPLNPGDTNVIPNSATLDNATFIARTTVTYNVGGTTVVLTNSAFRSTSAYVGLPAGTLLFTYSFTNTGTQAVSPLVEMSTLFRTLAIDVSSTDFAGFTRADRSADGNTITFRNFAANVSDTLNPGETSPLLVVRTNVDGAPGLIGTTTFNGVAGTTFAPLALVPEPGTFVLAAIGLPLAFGCYRRCRKKHPV